MKLYVGNLSFETTENDLQDLFEQHGTVNEVHLMMDRFTAKSRGFAFVTMNDAAQASAAMSALNGREVNGRTLTVNDFCCCMDFLRCRECLSRCLRDLRTDII